MSGFNDAVVRYTAKLVAYPIGYRIATSLSDRLSDRLPMPWSFGRSTSAPQLRALLRETEEAERGGEARRVVRDPPRTDAANAPAVRVNDGGGARRLRAERPAHLARLTEEACGHGEGARRDDERCSAPPRERRKTSIEREMSGVRSRQLAGDIQAGAAPRRELQSRDVVPAGVRGQQRRPAHLRG